MNTLRRMNTAALYTVVLLVIDTWHGKKFTSAFWDIFDTLLSHSHHTRATTRHTYS